MKQRDKRHDYKELVKDIIPILGDMEEYMDISKNEIIADINKDNPIIEVGDISIYIATASAEKNDSCLPAKALATVGHRFSLRFSLLAHVAAERHKVKMKRIDIT